MAKTVTTRLDEGYVKKIDEMAARKGIDRSALLRSFFLCALKEYTVRDSLEDYRIDNLDTLNYHPTLRDSSFYTIIFSLCLKRVYCT